MPLNREQLGQLLLRPTESLNVETKTWLDPRPAAGVAKLVKALFALRNRNGGTFVMGFNDATLLPDPYNLNGPVEQLFHSDAIQLLVSKYANQVFEIEVQLLPLDGVTHPVIVVPQGVTVPVVVKANLLDEGKPSKHLLAEGDLYFRTRWSNGTPSSAKIRPNDYGDLLDICFENREADIGRFLRRHLGGVERDAVLNSLFPPRPNPVTSLKPRCDELIKRGDSAFAAANSSRVVTQAALWMPKHPLTMRVALCVDPLVDGAKPTQDFLRAFASGNPNYTGWPMWLDSRAFRDEKSRPLVKDGAWQALILDLESEFPCSDFMLLDPRGDFFLRRLMQDDLRRLMTEPGKLLDVTLMLYRVTEVLAVGLAVAKSCGWAADGTAGFELCWSGLEGRSLGSWANPISWDPTGSGKAHDAEAKSFVDVPLDTPPTALAPYVSLAVSSLFSAFDGYVPSLQLVEDCVRRVIERKMS